MKKQYIKYAIFFDYQTLGQWNGKKELQVITDDPEKWLEEHNAQRDEGSEESLDDFIIEPLYHEAIYHED